MKFAGAFFLMLSAVISAAAQINVGKVQDKPRFAVIPTTDVMLTIAAQENCPLQLENARLLFNLSTGHVSYEYDLRNRGAKPIAAYQSEAWRINGTGGTLSNDLADKKLVLQPGQVLSERIDQTQLVPFTKEMRETLKFDSEMKLIIVLVVKEVFFADGSKYDGSKESDALRIFFEKIGDSDLF